MWSAIIALPPLTAITIALAYVGGIGWMYRRLARDPVQKVVPSSADRRSAEEALWKYYPAFPDDDPDTALFLLEEARREYDGWVETNIKIEEKATWLASFIAGTAGLLTVLGSAQGEKAHVEPGPFLALALLCAFIALAACIWIVRPKSRIHPSVSAYITARLALNSKSRFHLALALAEEYGRATVELATRRRFDPVTLTTAQGSIVLAAFAILIHFATHLSAGVSQPVVLQCRTPSPAYHGGSALKFTCEEHEYAR